MSVSQKSTAIAEMTRVMGKAGYDNFTDNNTWENCLCALVLALEPGCRTYRLMDALPFKKTEYDQIDAMNTMANLGYFARAVTMKKRDIDPRLFPCLFVSDERGPIVLLEKNDKVLRVYDHGEVVNIPVKTIKRTKGTAWIFKHFDESRQATSKFRRLGSGHGWFRALLGRFKGTFAQIMISGLMLNLLALATPLFIMLVYDRVIASGTLSTLPMFVCGIVIALFFEAWLRRSRSRGLSWLAARMDNIVSNKIFGHLTGLSPYLIERASVAAQIARLKTFESVRDFFSGSVFLSFLEIPFVILAVAAIYTVAGILVFVPLAMVALYCVLFLVMHHKVKVAIRLAAKASSARQRFTIETFDKLRAIRGQGLVRHWNATYRDLSGKEMVAHFRLNWLGVVSETCAHMLTLLSAVATVGFGVHLVWAGAMTTGALVASMILVWRILMPFHSLCTMIPRLEQIRNSLIQVDKLMDLNTETEEAKTSARLTKLKGHVRFEHAGIRYGQDSDPVFSNLDFTAEQGDFVVINGENGSGKTTILKMIKAMYRAQMGAVQIDGFDIRQLDIPDLRRQIAYMPQNPDFFTGSVIDNLRLGNPIADLDEICAALARADALSDVMDLPNGLDTEISRYGAQALPSSLVTRLSLARAYLHQAPILLIDELPNTLLSGLTGEKLKQYLSEQKGKSTIIMVSFREDFMELADTVVTLNRGRMADVVKQNSSLSANHKKVA